MIKEIPVVFDNIIFSLQHAGGISRCWSKIIDSYCHVDNALFIEQSDARENIYRKELFLSQRITDHKFPIQISRYINFKRQFFNDKFVFHSSYFRVNTARGCLNVTTVHDLIYEKFSKGMGAFLHVRQKIHALRKSDCIVCVSEHTRKDLLEYYPFCADKRIVVIPNGVDVFCEMNIDQSLFNHFAISNEDAYFLYVGHRGGCKGFDLIHEAIDILNGELKCVVVGTPFTQSELATIEKYDHSSKIIHVGKVNDYELNQLYCQARFFFFPSLYEGFGIPPLEAMSSGCPVLASNCSSIPEVVGGAGILFNPLDIEDLRGAVLKISNDNIRKELIDLGVDRAKYFHWDVVREKYFSLYSDLLDV